MIDKFASDIEPDEPPKADSGRPPAGDSKIPDGEGSSDPIVSKGIEKLKKEATSLHHMMTHIPKNPYCSVCNQAKMYKTPGYKTDGVRSVETMFRVPRAAFKGFGAGFRVQGFRVQGDFQSFWPFIFGLS